MEEGSKLLQTEKKMQIYVNKSVKSNNKIVLVIYLVLTEHQKKSWRRGMFRTNGARGLLALETH